MHAHAMGWNGRLCGDPCQDYSKITPADVHNLPIPLELLQKSKHASSAPPGRAAEQAFGTRGLSPRAALSTVAPRGFVGLLDNICATDCLLRTQLLGIEVESGQSRAKSGRSWRMSRGGLKPDSRTSFLPGALPNLFRVRPTLVRIGRPRSRLGCLWPDSACV